MAKKREILVITSKTKEVVKSLKCQSSGELPEAISNKIYDMLEAAAARAKKNGRMTIRDYDL